MLNIGSDDAVEDFFARLWSHHDRVDALVNNAARTYGRTGFATVTAETILEPVR